MPDSPLSGPKKLQRVPALRVFADHEQAALAALDRCEELLAEVGAERAARLALPTGRSYVPFYAALSARHPPEAAGPASVLWGRATGLNLDELVLPGSSRGVHPRSFAAYMQEHLWDTSCLEASRFSIPDTAAVYGGTEEDLKALCHNVDARAAELEPLDVALLGLGADGHIAYNLPHRVEEHTHAVELPDRLAEELEVPEAERPLRAVTVGFGPLRRARKILLLVAGAEKAEAMRQLFHGKKGDAWPCTLLREHPGFEIFADRAAAGALTVVADSTGSTSDPAVESKA